MKRPPSPSPSRGEISPPTTKRKVESTTTNKAVSSFFKPASQKVPEQLTWRIVEQTLVVGRYNPTVVPAQLSKQPIKVAAFDLDDTLITATGNKWARSAISWKWLDTAIPGRLKSLYQQGYLVVILSNQGNISLKDNPKTIQKDTISLTNLKTQIASILKQLDLPISLYAATGQDQFRKPRTGMWQAFLRDYDLTSDNAIDKEKSFYIGDAAGREKTDKRRKDHASSDRDLATNIGIPFQTPEEFFLNAETEDYQHPFQPVEYLKALEESKANHGTTALFKKKSAQELVIFCGSPGSGKSTFFWEVMQPQGFERVNQDTLKTRDRCLKVAKDHLVAGLSVAVDNTNADIEVRKYWIQLAKEFKVPIRCIRFTAPAKLCEHNDAVRALNPVMNPEKRTMLPGIAFRSFVQRFIEPKLEEGIQDITRVDFEFKGTAEQKDIWSKHWVSRFST